MNEFQYPLDAKRLIRKKEMIRKELINTDGEWLFKRIAILGGSTTDEVAAQLELFLLHYGIKTEIYQSEYGQYWEDAVFGNDVLKAFHPDVIYIHTNWRNIKQFPTITNTPEEVKAMLEAEYQLFETMWQALAQNYHCPVIQNNFDRPNFRLMGNRDIWDYRGKSNYISTLNQKFYLYAQEHSNFYINDLEYLAQDYGLSAWGNARYWHMYKYAMCLNAVPYVADSIAKIVKSMFGKNKKVLVLDLDDTLWGGIIGDDGVEGIQIGHETPKGQMFTEFQEYCRNLKQIGVVLAVNSKNDMENAMAGLNHPDGILKPDDFVDIKANWNTKDQNLSEIAQELTLGTDSFVFVDDNPAERAIVSARLPEVAIPEMDSAENYISALDHGGYFEVTALSLEDMSKTKKYQAKAEAGRAMSAFAEYGDYLESLQMTAKICGFEEIYIQRIAQITNKSNQFNLTTLRCTEDDIRTMQSDENYICLCGRLNDRFGEHGLVVATAGEILGKELHIRIFLMSCRVLKRGLEDLMMNQIVETAKEKGIDKIIGYYYPTAKNGMVKEWYSSMGFELKVKDDKENTVWSMEIDRYSKKKVYIRMENE